MAVRDRNLFAWQAYVITMAFVSVGLMLGMFFTWRWGADNERALADSKKSLSETKTEYTTSQNRVRRLRSMLGYGDESAEELEAMAESMKADAELGEIEKDFAEQMKLFAKTDKEKNLLKLPKLLMDTVRTRNREIDEAREREKAILAEQKNIFDRETAKAKAATEKMEAAQKDLESERANHANQIAALNAEKDEITKRFDDFRATFEKERKRLADANTLLTQTSKDQQAKIADLQEQVKQFREDDFAAPQGAIVRVDAAKQEVWLDIGSEDGLREGVPFAVVDATESKVSKAKPKARLQVTHIVSGDLSRAKIIDWNFKKLPVTGDKIYSPAWRPGRTVGFALVGAMDINGDTVDDSAMIKELIRMSGATVDVVLDANLSQTGSIKPGTAFLVLGSDTVASEASSQEQKEKLRKYKEFINKAKESSVTEMSLDTLLGYLRPRNSDRTITLGSGLNSANFPIETDRNPPSSTGRVSDLYYKRNPQ